MYVSFDCAVKILETGGPVVFPTDTVWGIGVAVRCSRDPQPLYKAKDRSPGKPVAWLVADRSALGIYGCDIPAHAHKLADMFWPGPLTLVVEASERVPIPYRSEEGTIGLRMPDCKVCRKLMEEVDSPLATTSANLSNMCPVPGWKPFDPALEGMPDVPVLESCRMYGSDGVSETASTVIDCTGVYPKILRAGASDSAITEFLSTL